MVGAPAIFIHFRLMWLVHLLYTLQANVVGTPGIFIHFRLMWLVHLLYLCTSG